MHKADRGPTFCLGNHNSENLKKLHSNWAALALDVNALVQHCTTQHRALSQFRWNSLQFSASVGSSPHKDENTIGAAIMFSMDEGSFELVLHPRTLMEPQVRFQLEHSAVVFEPSQSHSTTSSGRSKIVTAFYSSKPMEATWCETLADLGFREPSGVPVAQPTAPVGDSAAAAVEGAPNLPEPSGDGREEATLPIGVSPKITLRIYSEAFAGRNAQIIAELVRMKRVCLEPLEIESEGLKRSFDLSDDATYELVIRLAWSGVIRVHGGAPPCADYSSLRLLPNGPPALRTPDAMQGHNLTTFNRVWDYQTSQLLHKRHVHLCHVVVVMGGFFWEENPSSSFDKLGDFRQAFIVRSGAFLVNIATCADAYNDLPESERMEKAHCLVTNIPSFKLLGSVCSRHPSSHTRFAGVKDDQGNFISWKTAEFTPKLALAMAQAIAPLLTKGAGPPLKIERALELGTTQLRANQLRTPHQHAADGGGVSSTADWSTMRSVTARRAAPMVQKLREIVLKHDLGRKVAANIHRRGETRPWEQSATHEAIEVLWYWATQGKPIQQAHIVEADQPFRLNLCEAVAIKVTDQDVALSTILRKGIHTGCLPGHPIKPSGVWYPSTQEPSGDCALATTREPSGDLVLEDTQMGGPTHDFKWCEGKWKVAEENPMETLKLVEKEVSKGWVREWPGTLADAKLKWGQNKVAKGKLNVVMAPGKDSRLVLDSTINGLTDKVVQMERTFNPTPTSVEAAVCNDKSEEEYEALTADVAGAHKCIKIAEEEQGLMFFEIAQRLFYYIVCHFGGRWSAYWWSRAGAFFVRFLHLVIQDPHQLWLYVDDFLFRLRKKQFSETGALIFLVLDALGCPLSWKKQECGAVTWIGLAIDFRSGVWTLPEDKYEKMVDFLTYMSQDSRKLQRKRIEAGLGLMQWIIRVFPYMKPYLSFFYRVLCRPVMSQFNLPHTSMCRFLAALGENLSFTHALAHPEIPAGSSLLQFGPLNPPRTRKEVSELRPVPEKGVFVRISNPRSTEVRNCVESQQVAKLWLFQVRGTPLMRPMVCCKPVANLSMRADAWAAGDKLGIGGWWSSVPNPSIADCPWFTMQLSLDDFPPEWKLPADAQLNIAGFETLAQTALLVACGCELANRMGQIYVPSGSDNAPTVGAGNKLFSNKWPLAFFIINLHYWMAKLCIKLVFSHVKGIDNDWADYLSREVDLEKITARGWLPRNQKCMALNDLLKPQVAELFPTGCEAFVPRTLLKAINMMRLQAQGRS